MQYVSTVRWEEMIMWCYKICERTKVLVHTILGGSLKYKGRCKVEGYFVGYAYKNFSFHSFHFFN